LQTLPSILSNSGFIIPDWLLKNTSLKLMASLVLFCNPGEEMRREPGKAFIPASNEHLQGLRRANQDFVACIQKRHSEREATWMPTPHWSRPKRKRPSSAIGGYKAYQPFNVWWAEQKVVLHTEFRDGNVPAGYEQLRGFKEFLDMLPEGVTRVYLGSDTAGYAHDLLRYCEKGESQLLAGSSLPSVWM